MSLRRSADGCKARSFLGIRSRSSRRDGHLRPVQRLLFHAIGTTARLLGYRTYYPRFKPRGGYEEFRDREQE